ncbi:MAG: ATP-binding cassette domain-containing protein [Deltaproteobacteria bacterium]|jgi:NitT/TauT family transport system ATP-binding protein|nr:ATP-binding cassette domain-containing protein [Deltaproteobacteria bacterium]
MAGTRVLVRGLAKSYGQAPVLKDLDLTAEPGGSLALVGASGCGKTTVLRILAGLCSYDQGRVEAGQGRSCALVSQDPSLFPWKTVRQNLELPLTLAGADSRLRLFLPASIMERLELFGLADRYPNELSGGQRQRAALARALTARPRLLLLDEPFSALDTLARESLALYLDQVRRELGLTVILATHNIEEAVFLGQTVAVLGGRITKIQALFENPGPRTETSLAEDKFIEQVRQVRLALLRAEAWKKPFSESAADR